MRTSYKYDNAYTHNVILVILGPWHWYHLCYQSPYPSTPTINSDDWGQMPQPVIWSSVNWPPHRFTLEIAVNMYTGSSRKEWYPHTHTHTCIEVGPLVPGEYFSKDWPMSLDWWESQSFFSLRNSIEKWGTIINSSLSLSPWNVFKNTTLHKLPVTEQTTNTEPVGWVTATSTPTQPPQFPNELNIHELYFVHRS